MRPRGEKKLLMLLQCFYIFLLTRIYLSEEVDDLSVFCDWCAGQNENYTVIRFFHWLIHFLRRFRSAKLSFPIRGHSYLECDRDMGLVNQKTDVELPED
ncbi:hypothetical protein RRG08_005718 [Elysia crispata]|uniref:Secreted protein n=1 Tax=Elysia crispata TaxID=231223 RepID=A0AAE0YD63_9GAST|nr:hypothetical protein RRG08_005718 [Elysia crispata]